METQLPSFEPCLVGGLWTRPCLSCEPPSNTLQVSAAAGDKQAACLVGSPPAPRHTEADSPGTEVPAGKLPTPGPRRPGPGCHLQHRPQSARKGVVSAEICTSRTGTCGFVHFVTKSGSTAARAARPSLVFRSKEPLYGSSSTPEVQRPFRSLKSRKASGNLVLLPREPPPPGLAARPRAGRRCGCEEGAWEAAHRLQCPSPRTHVASVTAANGNRVGF